MGEIEKVSNPAAIGRRTALVAAGTVGIGLAGAAVGKAAMAGDAGPGSGRSLAAETRSGTAACVLTPEETAGPYYLDYELVRRNITEGYPGAPLLLRVAVIDTRTCGVLRGAALDVWHANALGEYSGYTALGVGGVGGRTGATPSPSLTAPPTATTPPGGGHTSATDKKTFLRGVQLTDAKGVAEFETIYPGWYSGRAIHIHVEVHIGGHVIAKKKYTGGHVAHTGQFFLPEGITEKVAKLEPYKTNKVTRLKNKDDSIFTDGDDSGLLTLTSARHPYPDAEHPTPGYVATIIVGVNPDATPASVGN